MRVAVVSDIHGNLTAFEAVLKDLREAAPDRIVHLGDLAGPGSSPVEGVDAVRGLGWLGVYGNTDEMLFRPGSLSEFAAGLPQLRPMSDKIAEMSAWMQAELGHARVAWLGGLPSQLRMDGMALVHASSASTWRLATDASIYGELGESLVFHGHTHQPSIMQAGALKIVNAGSVGQPLDGDPRACYVLLDDLRSSIRRVEYELERELDRVANSALPHADWIRRTLRAATPQAA